MRVKNTWIKDLEFYKSLKEILNSLNIEKDLDCKFTKKEKNKIARQRTIYKNFDKNL